MRSLQVFTIFLLVGAAVTVLYGRFVGPKAPAPVAATAAPSLPQAGPAPAPSAAASAPTPQGARPKPTDVQKALAKATRLAAKETYSHEQLHSLLQKSMAGKLSDRELTPSEYDRLADAILRIRASQRVLQGIDESDPGSEVRGVYSYTLDGAFVEIEQITGIPPSGWGDVLASQEPAENSGENVGRVQDDSPNTR